MDRKIIIGAGILAVLLSILLAGCIIPDGQENATVANISFKIGTGSNPVLGNSGAPVAIVEFTDYQCPYCGRHATATVHQLVSSYVETGKARYYLRDFPLSQIHENAQPAAAAARCAGDQGKYWEMHELLFRKQSEWVGLSQPELEPKFSSYAASIGINEELFRACYSPNAYSAQISADLADGQQYGITGTPSSIILLPKTANETKLLAVLSKYHDYASKKYISLARDPDGNYAFYVKGAFPYEVFSEVMGAAQ